MALVSKSIDNATAKLNNGPVVGEILKKVKDTLLAEFGRDAWAWYHAHADDVIFTIRKKVLVVNVNLDVRVHHCRPIFEQLAGPEPTDGLVQPLGAA